MSVESGQRAVDELREIPTINFYRSALTLESIQLLNTKASLKEIRTFLLNEIKSANEELQSEKKQIGLLDDKSENFFALNTYDITNRMKKVLIDPVLLNKGTLPPHMAENERKTPDLLFFSNSSRRYLG